MKPDLGLDDLLHVALAAIGLAAAVLLFPGCNPVHDIADTAYGEELAACVEKAHTLAESKACRADTRARWGIVTVDRKDAGHD